ncbi:MAG: hypothetical protein II853_07075 [Prevotella sp.]|nr:hypothetical protein [Prevotella sp.]
MKTIKNYLYSMLLLMTIVIGGSSLSSCAKDDNPAEPEVTLEDALKDGTIVAFTFNLNGEEFYVAFLRVGDTYELLDVDRVAWTRGDDPVIAAEDCTFLMEQDKANGLLRFYVNEKKTSKLIFTAILDINQSTVEVIPGDSDIKVTGFKMKVSNVEITNLLKDVSDGVTLADALVKGSKVVITYKWDNNTTVFTFINKGGGTFSCDINGPETEYVKASLTLEGGTLFFSAKDWTASDFDLEIKFNVANNSYKFWTITHDTYQSHTISVNGVDITKKLTRERD